MNRFSADIDYMKRVFVILIVFMAMLSSMEAHAQRFSVSTNLLGYACLGTLNAEGAVSLSQKWSVVAGVRYNPFSFRKETPQKQFQLRQQSYCIGARLWPWHTWSGWWFSGKLRYQEYNFGGIVSSVTEEGDRFGAGVYTGYTHMLSPHLNIEFGIGMWGGADMYRRYSCQVCGETVGVGKRYFLFPDDIMISLVYVF